MIYTHNTVKAINIAYNAHMGTYDRTGVPYIFHPFHVAEQMDDEDSTIVALLHDVVEDTEITFEDLEKEGFSEKVIEALKLMTHDKSVDYMEYVKALGKNPLARKVKLGDLTHNMDATRDCGAELTERAKNKRMLYRTAYEYLSSLE